MSIFGVGTDIIGLERIEQSLARTAHKFVQRILAEQEIKEYEALTSNKAQIAFLAKRFAAKEATSKALGTGMRQGIDFKQLIVVHDALGKPEVKLTGAAKDYASEQRISKLSISISDERQYAVAFVIAEQ